MVRELTGKELDAVTGGVQGQNVGAAAGLIAAGVGLQVQNVLNNNNPAILNNNHTDVAVAVLGVAVA